MKKLFLIGNGFDRNIELKTTYSDFRTFLVENNVDVLEFEESFPKLIIKEIELWSNFEQALSLLDTRILGNRVNNSIQSYHKEFTELDYYDVERVKFYIQDLIRQELDNLTSITKEHLKYWIDHINSNKSVKLNKSFKKESKFINFNYTNSLEKYYNVHSKDIVYVHGSFREKELIIGHGERVTETILNRQVLYSYDGEEFELSLNNDTLKLLEKDVANHCLKLVNMTNFISEVKCIYVLGHSLSSVDDYYFEYILSKLEDNAHWVFSFRSDDDYKNVTKFCYKYNIVDYEILGIDTILAKVTVD